MTTAVNGTLNQTKTEMTKACFYRLIHEFFFMKDDGADVHIAHDTYVYYNVISQCSLGTSGYLSAEDVNNNDVTDDLIKVIYLQVIW